MRCESARRMMMDRLYEALPPDKSKMLDTHIESCPVCAEEWKDVQAAHSYMKFMPDKAVPAHLQQAVLQQSQSGALPPEPESFWRNWPKWAAAAVIIITAGIGYSLWDPGNQKALTDAKLSHPDLNRIAMDTLNGSINKEEPDQESAYSYQPIQEDSLKEKEAVTTNNPEPSADSTQPVVLVSSASASSEAEKLFQTTLRLYNTAFTKIGKDKKAMLRSAIVMQDDLEKKYPEEIQWIAMGMILKADAYRALDAPEKAIETYQEMTERFAHMPGYCQQARFSTIELMLEHKDQYGQIEQQLTQYQALVPPPAKFAYLAMEYSEKVAEDNPETAVKWYQRVQKSLPPRHPVYNKAAGASYQLEQKIREKHYIEDWKIIGPFPQDTILETSGLKSHVDAFSELIQKSEQSSSINLVQRKPEENPDIDLNKLLKQSPKNTSAFSQTFIYSPIEQDVQLIVGFSDGMRVWLNGEPISGGMERNEFRRDIHWIGTKLNKGWNHLLLKNYHFRDVREWKFSVIVSDNQGHILPELKYDALYQPASDTK